MEFTGDITVNNKRHTVQSKGLSAWLSADRPTELLTLGRVMEYWFDLTFEGYKENATINCQIDLSNISEQG